MESGVLIALIGAVVAILTGLGAHFWSWYAGRKKQDADAQSALVPGFVALLAEFKNERTLLVARIDQLEADNYRMERHLFKLERLLNAHDIDVPTRDVI